MFFFRDVLVVESCSCIFIHLGQVRGDGLFIITTIYDGRHITALLGEVFTSVEKESLAETEAVNSIEGL